jgi:hypothetical protein
LRVLIVVVFVAFTSTLPLSVSMFHTLHTHAVSCFTPQSQSQSSSFVSNLTQSLVFQQQQQQQRSSSVEKAP